MFTKAIDWYVWNRLLFNDTMVAEHFCPRFDIEPNVNAAERLILIGNTAIISCGSECFWK